MAAVHPYSASVRNVVRIVRLYRDVMRRFGDARKPLLVTEVSWSSGRGHVRDAPGFLALTERGQADRVAEAIPALARQRAALGIAGIHWYDWLSPPIGVSGNAFAYSGLRRQTRGRRIVFKPAYFAYRAAARRLQGCEKTQDARRCR